MLFAVTLIVMMHENQNDAGSERQNRQDGGKPILCYCYCLHIVSFQSTFVCVKSGIIQLILKLWLKTYFEITLTFESKVSVFQSSCEIWSQSPRLFQSYGVELYCFQEMSQ